MFRVTLLKRVVSNYSDYDLLIRNFKKLNSSHLNQCKCMSSGMNLKSTHNIKQPALTTKIKHEENDSAPISTELSEKEFLVRLKNDPDRFGIAQENDLKDKGDIIEEKHFTEQPVPSQKLRTKQYADMIKSLIRQRKIKEAIDVVEVRMLKDDRVKPEGYIFNLLLGACGRVGYTKKAFMLYNEMKRRGLNVMGGTYTALFNACANSPWPKDGLARAQHLYNIMIEKGFEPNDTVYNVMIKAFGRCGDLPMAFKLVDEMRSKRIRVKDDTINFLFQACISDKEAGFRHALLVWRKLLDKRIKPSIYTYNLMLRCIRDCGLGSIEATKDVIDRIVSGSNIEADAIKSNLLEGSNTILLPSLEETNESKSVKNSHALSEENQLQVVNDGQEITEIPQSQNELDNIRPDLMAKVPHLGNLISLSEVTKPEERLLLVGGCSGFLRNMEQHNCTPNIKTFTQLLDSIPNTAKSEKELIRAMRKLNVKPDIDFYNMLMKKRSMRFDYEGAKEVLISMQQQKYRPNVMTYGILALGCKTKEEGMEVINEMKAKSYSLNAEILGTMLRQACCHQDFSYVLEIMETCLRENVQPNKIFMQTLVDFRKKCRVLLNSKKMSTSQEKHFRIFWGRYKNWLQEVQVDESEDAHPWQQFRQTTKGGEKYKWKDTRSRFKARHTSLFRVKTSTKRRM